MKASTAAKELTAALRDEMAACAMNLAILYIERGRFNEAEPLVQRALAIYEQQLSPDHLESVESLVVVGVLCYKQGRYTEAGHFLERSLAICEQLLIAVPL